MRFRELARFLLIVILLFASLSPVAIAQVSSEVSKVALQPLAQQVRQIESALSYLGQPLSEADVQRINAAIGLQDESAAVSELERVLDQYALVIVTINAESRVKAASGPAKPELVEKGTRIFLVKVLNGAGVTSQLQVQSENSGSVYLPSTGSPEPPSLSRLPTCNSDGRTFRCTTRIPCQSDYQGCRWSIAFSRFIAATPANVPRS